MNDIEKSYELSSSRIKYLREENELTLEEFGKIAGVGKSSVFRWEEGEVKNINTNCIIRISEHFQVNPLWLLGYDVPKRKATKIEEELQREISDLCYGLDEKQLCKIKSFIKDYIL